MSRRTIGVFTGNRAEYGMQYPILLALKEHPDLDYHLLVSGAHLKEDFGKSLQEIKSDGFPIYAEVAIEMPGDSLQSTAHAIGSGIVSLSHILADLQPDIFLVYADRFESFAAMVAGTQMGIPTAHVEGGDYTEGGALDDSVRHAMTKLAHLHFTTNESAAERVLRLGEEPWRVFTVGLPALDLVTRGMYASSHEVVEQTGIRLDAPLIVFTQHSVTTEFDQAEEQIKPGLRALARAVSELGCQVIVTYPNDDAGGARIRQAIERFRKDYCKNFWFFPSLGRYLYHGVLAMASACVGNSSSGIKETPAFKCPTVNIGTRQQGRLRADNILDVDYDEDAILNAIKRCLTDEHFKQCIREMTNPYGAGNAGPRIAEVLGSIELSPKLIRKKMTY